MFPEFRSQSKTERDCVYFNGKKSYRSNGRIFDVYTSNEDFLNKLSTSSTLTFVDNFSDPEFFDLVYTLANTPGCKVISDKKGTPILARVQVGRSTRWIVRFSTWDLPTDRTSLKVLEDTFTYIDLGTAPTPSSLGRRSMRYVYDVYNLGNHTTVPVSCEKDFHDHGFGGIVVSNYTGRKFHETLQSDKKMAYVSKYTVHPDDTPEYFLALDNYNQYETWFAHCRIHLNRELPLGIFPVRVSHKRVAYPTRKGYYDTWIWKETAITALENGCDIDIMEGWGWSKMTTDNDKWAEWIYRKRLNAPTEEVEKEIKKISVSAIGSQNRGRDNFVVVGENVKTDDDFPVLRRFDAINLWVHSDRDDNSATMVHWNNFTINGVNNDVRSFALPYAERGDLILIDYDAIFVKEVVDRQKLMYKHSIESLLAPPGSWIWKLHHNFEMLRTRMWVSDEEPDRYGSLLEGIR